MTRHRRSVGRSFSNFALILSDNKILKNISVAAVVIGIGSMLLHQADGCAILNEIPIPKFISLLGDAVNL